MFRVDRFVGLQPRHRKRTRLSRRFNAPHQYLNLIDGSTGKTHEQERIFSADSTRFFVFFVFFAPRPVFRGKDDETAGENAVRP